MPVEIIMPKVDMDMSHGTVAEWHVGEGEMVKKGAALFDIETDKAAMEVEAPAEGRLHHIQAQAGARIAVGTVIAWLYAEGEEVGDPPVVATPDNETTRPADQPEHPPVPDVGAATTGADGVRQDGRSSASTPARPAPPVISREGEVEGGALRATPAARALAREHGLDLAGLEGSGPRGRLQRQDVEVAAVQARSASGSQALRPAWSPQPGPLSITRKPGEGTPIVLLHGFASDGPSFLPLEKALGRGRPVIRIELPGHGRSPRRKVESFAALARMMVEAFDEATAGQDKVHLVGHSLGGALAMAIADVRGRGIASLGLIAPAGLGPEIDGETVRGIARASREDSLAPWLRRLAADPATIGDDFVKAAMAPRRDPALRAAQLALADVLFPDNVQAFDLRPALRRITSGEDNLPVAILWGRHDAVIPWRQVLAVGGEYGIHLVDDAGHVPQIECPGRVARVLGRLMNAAGSAP
uniref:acetoin dehydrogenase dihydrolipoyllysine-residue acetyltransferase subunit n=1 Tax=Stappia sp. TaxID=1870903 RepID=UPI003BAD2701